MKCKLCGKEVLLVPSAKQRAEKCGGEPDDTLKLFDTHAACYLSKRTKDTSDFLKQLNR